jgi:hypothetical protein
MALTGDMLIGRHPLDLLSQTSNPEIATIGNYGSEAYIRFYNSNNPNSGHIFGINSNGALFASNISGGESALRIDTLQVSTIASTRNDSNITFRDVNLLGLCNVQLIGQLLDKDGNPYSLSGGGGGTGGFAEYSLYYARNPLSEPTRIIQTNDPTLENRALFAVTILAGRFYLNATVAYKNVDNFIPIDSTSWASANIYNGSLEQYAAGTATLVQMNPFFSTTTTPGATMYFTFNCFVDSLTGLANANQFVVVIEGAGHRLSFEPNTVTLRAIPVQTSTGLGSTAGDGTLFSRSIQITPIRSVFTVNEGSTCNMFNLVTPGNFIASSNSCQLYLNGTKMAYLDDNRRDYSFIYNYNGTTSSTVFTVALAEPAVSGDVVDVTIYPELTTSNAAFNNSYFYQANSITSSPWLSLLNGGVRCTKNVVIDGNLIVQGDIVGGCNLLLAGIESGTEFDTRMFANLSSNVIGSINIADFSILPRHLNLTNGNVGIGTTNPLRLVDIRGDLRLDGIIYDASNVPMWLPSRSLEWKTPLSPPIFTIPGGGAVSYSRSNALYRWIGDDIGYNVNVAAIVTAVPTGTLTASACNYLLSLPYPINAAAYPADTIIGDLWLSTISSNAGTSNAFKAYARSLAGNANAVTIRALTGTTDESLAVLTVGTRMTLQGTLIYRTTSINQSLSVPAFYTPAQIAQDQDGNIGVNLPSAQPPRGGMDVYASNVTAGLVIDQVSTGDIVEFKQGGVTKVVIDAAGNLGVGTGTAQAPVYIEANSSSTAGIIVNQVGSGAIMELKDAGVSKIVVDGNGNVGIGTANPIAGLHIEGYIKVNLPYCQVVGATCGGTIGTPNVLLTGSPSTYYRLTYQTVINNYNSLFDTTNKYIKINTKGLYYIHASAPFSSGAGNNYNIYIIKNSTIGNTTTDIGSILANKIADGMLNAVGFANVQSSTIAVLNQNDYIEIYINYEGTGGAYFRNATATSFSSNWTTPVITSYMITSL